MRAGRLHRGGSRHRQHRHHVHRLPGRRAQAQPVPQAAGRLAWRCSIGDFIVYKARRAGVPLVFVDPADSSKECAECGHVDRLNRVSQAKFVCRSCGVVAHADRNASRVLAHRGEDVWIAGRESRVPATP
ncbi:zinc ribbon domain-containing protein [Streptomyces sp. NPDC002573]|uniref:zinc ribbon domain-containing protein n=1 Tax=Streptomyces sp. NPDC002573 TaxID=3364651 RepID=UPI0036868619